MGARTGGSNMPGADGSGPRQTHWPRIALQTDMKNDYVAFKDIVSKNSKVRLAYCRAYSFSCGCFGVGRQYGCGSGLLDGETRCQSAVLPKKYLPFLTVNALSNTTTIQKPISVKNTSQTALVVYLLVAHLLLAKILYSLTKHGSLIG